MRPRFARGWCCNHYKQWWKYGTPHGRPRGTLEERFWRSVEFLAPDTDGCWVWQGRTDPDGYGAITDKKRGRAAGQVRAHRVSWEMTNGPIPAGAWVLHHCDNRPCVRPSHLYLGDVRDNTDDRVVRERGARGRKIFRAKLSPDLVRDIRARHAAGERSVDLARDFHVADTTITSVVQRRTWRWVS